MPVFQPSKRNGFLRLERGGEDGLVLDLDTAVKGGILGGFRTGGGGGGGNGGILEKFDLERLIEEVSCSSDDDDEVPSVFICPVSLEPMRDPVTLCTGQTYDKHNIVKWLRLGRCTCPTTMQELWDDSLTPNVTLRRLISAWFSRKHLQMEKKSQDAHGRALELLESLKTVKGQRRIQALGELHRLVAVPDHHHHHHHHHHHSAARIAVVDAGGVALLSSLLGPFTSYSVASRVIPILVGLREFSSESKRNLLQPARVSSIVDTLNEGSIDAKLACIRLIAILMDDVDFRVESVSSHSLLVALMRVVRDKNHPTGHLPGLALLKSMALHEKLHTLMVEIGAVPQLVELCSTPSWNPDCVELSLFVLDALSARPEGRRALKECPKTVPVAAKLLMRISEECTGHALSILSSACRGAAPEECVPTTAVDAGLAAKLLLVMQSGCRQTVKQKAAEVLKICRSNYSDSMFISKCKLTRTI
ncbi:hypothetical protein M569_12322, partial [Genlisea aurea]